MIFRNASLSLVVLMAGCLYGMPGVAAVSAQAPTAQQTLDQIHHINQKEIQLAGLALDKTKDPQVIAFAHKMIHDHSAADKKTEQVARRAGIRLQAFQLSDREKMQMDRMQKMTDAQFDAAYMDAMKTGHQQALQFLRASEKEISDTRVKSLISKLIPAVQHHEDLATRIAANVNEKARHQYAGRAAGQAGDRAGQAGH